VTRAHRGVLFLDELGEFRRDAIEALREPLEEGRVTLSRARRSIELPCRFTLVAASNPCPCGHGAGSGACECVPAAVARYEAKLSGALADRIDVFVGVGQPPADAMAGDTGEASADVRARVEAARAVQRERFEGDRCNADLTPAETRRHCRPDPAAEAALRDGHDRLRLSGRGWDRVLRVARTIADLESAERIGEAHIGEALGLRRRSLA
jgi:magnesium chelatase family protein